MNVTCRQFKDNSTISLNQCLIFSKRLLPRIATKGQTCIRSEETAQNSVKIAELLLADTTPSCNRKSATIPLLQSTQKGIPKNILFMTVRRGRAIALTQKIIPRLMLKLRRWVNTAHRAGRYPVPLAAMPHHQCYGTKADIILVEDRGIQDFTLEVLARCCWGLVSCAYGWVCGCHDFHTLVPWCCSRPVRLCSGRPVASHSPIQEFST